MDEKRNDRTAHQRNEGEGNRTAAREYNQSQQHFVESGKVAGKAREAEQALDDKKLRRELEQAEMVGKRHIAEEDPQIKR